MLSSFLFTSLSLVVVVVVVVAVVVESATIAAVIDNAQGCN